jgi:ribosome-associated toxin RatA of RatAB toxin-antitoxin module
MPEVSLDLDILAPIDRVWEAIVDVTRYPDLMANVISVEIRRVDSPEVRRTAWSVVLKGSILEWEEEEHIDSTRRLMSFGQISGDMAEFVGSWQVSKVSPSVSNVRLNVQFDIGIPLLADMLNPVAKRALRENCADMLRGIERRSRCDSDFGSPVEVASTTIATKGVE